MSIELENHQPDCKIAIGALVAPPRGVGRGNPRAAARTLLDAFGSRFPPPSLVTRLSLANSLLLHLLILLLREDPRHGNLRGGEECWEGDRETALGQTVLSAWRRRTWRGA
jgi:hypothetical protein